MSEHAAPIFSGLVAISIALPSSAAPLKLIDLLAAGTILTPSADLQNWITNASRSARRALSAVVDNVTITGSSPLTRYFASLSAQAIIENHASSFLTGWESTMTLPMTRASGTAYTTPAGLNGVRRVYVSSATTSPINVTAVCLLSSTDVAAI